MRKWILVTAMISLLLIPQKGFSQDNTVLFGINVPLSGAYSEQGEDELKAYRLAINIINEKGGVLGKKIVYSVKDTQTDADVARENARSLVEEGAIMITGGSSSAVAIAQSEECQEAGVVFMAALTHSNATTGENAHRHTFRWYNNGHLEAAIKTIKAGKLHGLYLPEPFGTMAEREGIAVAVEGQQDYLTGTLMTVLVIHSETMNTQTAAVREWLMRVVSSCHFIEHDIQVSGGRQTAIIQSSYLGYPRDIVAESLAQRKGDLSFGHELPTVEEYQELQNEEFDVAGMKKMFCSGRRTTYVYQ